MKVRERLLDIKARLSDRHLYSATLVFLAIIAALGLFQYKKALDYRAQVEYNYQRAFFEMASNINNIDAALNKATLATNSTHLSYLSADLSRQTAFAQSNLGQLPLDSSQSADIAKFLNQVGDYTYSLAEKAANNHTLTTQEVEHVNKLSEYAAAINDSIQQLENSVEAGGLRIGEVAAASSSMGSASSFDFGGEIGGVNKEITDYPILIYDGPFSDHMLNNEPILTVNMPEITVEQARAKAEDLFKDRGITAVEKAEDIDGKIPCYAFNLKTSDNNRQISVQITKKGGIVQLVLDNKEVTTDQLSVEEALKKAKEFMSARGMTEMRDMYYERQGNTLAVNFVFSANDVVFYADLIQLRIAMDTGEMVGYEARNYILAHHGRKLATPQLTAEQAKAKVNSQMEISNVRMAVIPSEGGTEYLCYEVKGKFNDHNYLVYIDVVTGREVKTLILIETPEGVLTM